jgi:hypothetical protein
MAPRTETIRYKRNEWTAMAEAPLLFLFVP